MRFAKLAAAALLAAMAAPAAPSWAQQDIDSRLNKAADVSRGSKPLDALKTCEDVIAGGEATPEQKIRALRIIIDAQLKTGKPSDATATAQRIATVIPGPAGKQASAYAAADVLRMQNKPADAVAGLQAFLATNPEKPVAIDTQLRIAEFLSGMQKYDEAAAEASKALDADPENETSAPRALGIIFDAATRSGQHDKAIAAINRLLAAKFTQKRDDSYRRDLRRKLNDELQALKRFDEARANFAAAEKAEKDDKDKQYWIILTGDSFVAEGNCDAAVKAYERVFVEFPRTADYWLAAQKKIADAYLADQKPLEAIKAMHVVVNVTTDGGQLADAVRRTAEMFKNVDGNVGRANQFIQFERFGPAGEDGKGGLTNPMDTVGYAAYPEREKAFAAARDQAGDSAASMRFRAQTYLYCGQPKQALKCYLDAFARCTMDEFQRSADDLVLIGVRAIRGHPVGLEEFYTFLNYGPAGPDGKTGTADDLKDPFEPLLK